ncbi:MAG TPA: helix-turn-helix domain-containing protein [Polyangiaceae bacterium]|nr:helix-turn-helix domain-containing protein [Polyangiaceae bacterium]
MTRRASPRIDSAPYRQLEDVLGCKWSVLVLRAIASGVCRPGALERHIGGISTKVLGERLRKLEAYKLINKTIYDTVPPRTTYELTAMGQKLIGIIEQIRALDEELQHGMPDTEVE